MNRNVVALVLTAGLTLTAAGCSTKKYVRQQTTPIINKTNELDELTRNTSNEIRNVDQRAQQGISAVDAKAAQADQKALTAGQLADQAQGVASQASNRAGVLQNTVANLDNYHPVTEASVHFGFNQGTLTKKAQQALDEFITQVGNQQHF